MHIFCSGIGGIGLSAYAMHMRARGHEVSGSDRAGSTLIDELRKSSVSVSFDQSGAALPDRLDLFVYSEAIPADAPERVLAKERGIRQISYFAAVGALTAGKQLVAICGTHGKSSTTAMAARLAIEAGLDPNVIVGTKTRELGGKNFRVGGSDLWIVEACEYRRSFRFLKASIILLTNADGDHFDYFRDENDYQRAFAEFLSSLPANGVVIIHGTDPVCAQIARRAGRAMVDADRMPLIALAIPGKHMRQNAQLVLALAKLWKLDEKKSQAIVAGFTGSWRRMEEKGTTVAGITMVDDYAHHPVEIRATLSALRERYPGRRIVCVFQPHTHDRTLKLWKEFSLAFRDADLLILTDVYDARPDREKESVDVSRFAEAIRSGSTTEVVNVGQLEHAEKAVRELPLSKGDVVVTMGAGTITQLADRLLK